MALFRRTPQIDPAAFAALRDEVARLTSRLTASEAAKASVEKRLAELESSTTADDDLERRLAEIEQARAEAPAATPPPPPPTVSLDDVKAIAEQAARLAEAAERRVDSLESASPSGPDDAQPSEVLDTLAAVQAQMAQLAERVAMSTADTREAREVAAALEVRITQLGHELAMQIDELAGEIEAVHRRAAAGSEAADPAVLDELRAAQVRLANEQARYEISFRQDLAELADRLLQRRI